MEALLLRSMISGPERLHRLATLLLLAVLAGCGPTKVVVEGNFPEPLM